MSIRPDSSGGADGISDAVKKLAAADFSDVAASFAAAGFTVTLPARGILQIVAPAAGKASGRMSLLVSVGIHGDETAPIEMLALALAELARAPDALAVDLLVVVGNLDAIARGKRFIDVDMNRLFRSDRGALPDAAETRRADAIMAATQAFFASCAPQAGPARWHLDLHTAIRPSLYPAFAIVPEVIPAPQRETLIEWLGGAGIDAAILNPKLAGTFSSHTALQFGASGCTVELGRIGALGANDLSQFATTRRALDTLLRTGSSVPATPARAHVFNVTQELVKHSDAFTMAFDGSTGNFTAMEPGALIAQDGDVTYRVGAATEYVVFPNPDVRPGQRAGLMVVRRS